MMIIEPRRLSGLLSLETVQLAKIDNFIWPSCNAAPSTQLKFGVSAPKRRKRSRLIWNRP